MSIIGAHIDLPAPEPRAPGPFALGEQDYVTDLLQSAGFTGIAFDTWSGNLRVGGPGSDPASAAQFVLDGMQTGDLIGSSGAEAHAAILGRLADLLARNSDGDAVRLGAKARPVRAAPRPPPAPAPPPPPP